MPKSSYQQLLGNNERQLKSKTNAREIDFIAAESETNIYKKSDNYALVVYNLFLYDQFGETFEAQSELILIDTMGKVVHQLRLPHIIRTPLVTDNGKFLFANYGGAYSCTEFEYVEPGFKVYDVERGKIIYEESREGDSSLNPHIKDNRIIYGRRAKGGYLHKIYDFSKKKLYTKYFKKGTLGYASYVKNGFRAKDETGEFVIYLFERDFETTNLNLVK